MINKSFGAFLRVSLFVFVGQLGLLAEGQVENTPQSIQETSLEKKSIIRVAAVAQYVKGGAEKVHDQVSEQIKFNDVIYEGEAIQTDSDSILKLVTPQGCIIVLYGSGNSVASNRDKPWKLNAEGVRVLCDWPSSIRTRTNGRVLEVKGGEFLDAGGRLLVLRGLVAKIGKLSLFSLENGRMKKVVPPPTEQDIWKFNSEWPPPEESEEISEPKVEEPQGAADEENVRSRAILLGPALGLINYAFDHESLESRTILGGMGRFQYRSPWGQAHNVFAMSLGSFNNGEDIGRAVKVEGVRSRFDLSLFEWGVRFNRLRWWTFYVRGGGGFVGASVASYRSSTSPSPHYTHRKYTFAAVSAAGGLELVYSPGFFPWAGLSLAGEVFGVHGVARLKQETLESDYLPAGSTAPPDPGRVSLFGLSLGLGLVISF